MKIVQNRPSPGDWTGALAGVAPWLPPHLETLWDNVSPAAADAIIVPYVFWPQNAAPHIVPASMDAFLARLPFWQGAQDRHILLDASDTAEPYATLGPAALFKTSASLRWPGVQPLPFLVPDPGEVMPIDKAAYDVSFVGCLETHPIRPALARWVKTWTGLNTSFHVIDKPFYGGAGERSEAAVQQFREQMHATRFALCPRGRGMNSRRFFEALAMGRIPVLYSDAAHLPLSSRIDYTAFVVHVPEGMGRWTPDYLVKFLDTHNLADASLQARQAYTTWFAPKRFRAFIEAALAHR